MSVLPWDRDAFNPARWKLAVGVTVIVVAFLVVVFGGIAAVGHRNEVIARLMGDWASVSGPSARLSIEPKTADGFGLSQEPALTPLVLSGFVDGQKVNGEFEVSRWPPWSSTAHATVNGARWTLHLDLSHDSLTVVTADGRTIALQ